MIERGLKHEINNKNCSLWIIKKELKKENLWNVFHGTVCLRNYMYIFFFSLVNVRVTLTKPIYQQSEKSFPPLSHTGQNY